MDFEVCKRDCLSWLSYNKLTVVNSKLKEYVDVDYVTDYDRRRSTSSMVFTFSDNTVSWKSNLQFVVALSTTEVEYMAATEGVKEALWLKELTAELLNVEMKYVEVFSDNQSVVTYLKTRLSTR